MEIFIFVKFLTRFWVQGWSPRPILVLRYNRIISSLCLLSPLGSFPFFGQSTSTISLGHEEFPPRGRSSSSRSRSEPLNILPFKSPGWGLHDLVLNTPYPETLDTKLFPYPNSWWVYHRFISSVNQSYMNRTDPSPSYCELSAYNSDGIFLLLRVLGYVLSGNFRCQGSKTEVYTVSSKINLQTKSSPTWCSCLTWLDRLYHRTDEQLYKEWHLRD